MSISAVQRRAVTQRAGRCCEYCRLTEIDELAPFHVDQAIYPGRVVIQMGSPPRPPSRRSV